MTQAADTLPDLSIVIVNWNTRDMLRACLTSLRTAAQTWPHFEVIVVDNASSDGSPDMIRSEFPEVRLIAAPKNLGFGGGNNLGFAAARAAKVVATVNSDTEVIGDALEKMCAYFTDTPDCGAAGPKLLNTDGTVQLSCRKFPGFMTALFNRYSLLTRLFPNNAWSREYLMSDCGHGESMNVDWVSGAALFVRREVFDQIGAFDEDYFMYSEDVDWCYRIHRAGWRVAYVPDAVMTHHIGRSTDRAPFKMVWQRHRSMWVFYRKLYSSDIVILDIATWMAIWGRCTVQVAGNALKRLSGRKAKS